MFRMIQRLASIAPIVFASIIPSTAYSKDVAMNNITTLCFGRFLIDLPADLHIKQMGQQSRFMYGEITSVPYMGGVDEFTRKMEQREADAYNGKNPDNFKFVDMKKTSIPNTRIFIFNDDVFDRKLFQVEMYHFENGFLYSLLQGPYNNKTIGGVVEGLEKDLIAKLRYRVQDEIPVEPGFCIKNGFIADSGSPLQFEEARIQLNFKEWPDVWVKFYSQTVHKAGDESLLQRLAKFPDTPLELAMIKTFRKGNHVVSGFKGEEILQLLPTEEGIKQHVFYWEALGAVNDIFAPLLTLEFQTAAVAPDGTRPRPSLTNDQAINLYDTIVNSIRLRPTKDRASQDDSHKTPLDERAATGRTCPQTGWWQSDDPAATTAGLQHFTAGDIFPKVTLDPKSEKWQGVKRQSVPPQKSTVWKLVEYDQGAASLTQQKPLSDADASDKPASPARG